MVQLTIPQSLVGSLIDIAQLKDITYYPANHRCAHWAVYSEDQTELLCPCAPAESASVEKLFSAASEILYKNFRHRIETPTILFLSQLKSTKMLVQLRPTRSSPVLCRWFPKPRLAPRWMLPPT